MNFRDIAARFIASTRARETDWWFTFALLTKNLVDGTRAGGLLMRHRHNGRLEYRRLNQQEEIEWLHQDAW